LKEQYNSQLKLLSQVGVLEILPEIGKLGIVGIDGEEYPFPEYEEILSRIDNKVDIIKTKREQGFEKMIITPFAMPLELLADRYKRVILKHNQSKTLLATDGATLELDINQPLYISDNYKQADVNNELIYYPKQFDKINHGGQTKQEILDQAKLGFNVALIENLPDLPAENKGKTIAGRKQLEANQTPKDYLKTLQTDEIYNHESGQTAEGWLTYALTSLEESNQVIDDWSGQGKLNYNLATYFPDSAGVSDGFWCRDGQRAYLDYCGVGDRLDNRGFRPEVRI